MAMFKFKRGRMEIECESGIKEVIEFIEKESRRHWWYMFLKLVVIIMGLLITNNPFIIL
jgi:hypothetical protein